MEIREGETVLKVYHHHSTPFIFWLLKIIIGFLPFFLILFFLQDAIPTFYIVLAVLLIVFVFVIMVIYKSFIFWMDKLYITNQRIIYVNWLSFFTRKESEAMLNDIQDIKTREKGVISYFRFFDYGDFSLTTASAKTTLKFELAPDPEGIRQYIYHIRPQ